MKCPVCGALSPNYNSVCPVCGAILQDSYKFSSKEKVILNYGTEYETELEYDFDNEETIHYKADEIIPKDEYRDLPSEWTEEVPDTAQPLLQMADRLKNRIMSLLYTAPSFIQYIKANIPIETLRPVFTNEQLKELKNGTLKLLSKKNGSMLATLVDPNTNKIVAQVPLEKVNTSPEIGTAMTNLASQMQMAQIARQIADLQKSIEEIQQGLEYDRLATAYSCEQKLLQAMSIRDPQLKASALMHIAADAEDSRNRLMLTQGHAVELLMNEPESFWLKLVTGSRTKKIDNRISEIRTSLDAVSRVSITQAIAYQQLGESDAARIGLEHYGKFIESTYMSDAKTLERLDMLDPATEQYWTHRLPSITQDIQALPVVYGAIELLPEIITKTEN